MARKEPTDDLVYEVNVRDPKTRLLRRDWMRYRGIRLAKRECERLQRLGVEAEVRPWADRPAAVA